MAIYRGSGGSLDGQTESLSFPVSISQGGTGQTDANKAFNALAPNQTSKNGRYLKTDGVNTSWDDFDISTADINGVLPVANGGTGASNVTTARDNLGLEIGVDIPATNGTGATGTWSISVTGNAATVTDGVYTSGSYSNPSWLTGLDYSKLSGTVPTWNQNTTGTASNVTGTVAIANGGTGATTASNARVGLLPSYTGNGNKVLALNAGATDVEWTAAGAGAGDVVGPASSTDNAIARFDSTTGRLLQNSVVTVGDTGAVSGVTTLAASTSVTSPIVQATNSAGLALRNSAGTTQISMGGGGGDNVTIAVATNINGANAQIDISPTGTGHVHIKPTGTGSLEIAPTNVGTVDNMTIGATTARAITGTTITANTGFTGNVTGNVSGTAANVTGTVAIANGGTGATTRQDAMDALAGSTTSGQYLRGNGTDVVMSAIQAGDVPTLNQNTTGSAATLTTGRTVAITGDLSYTSGSFDGSGNVTGTGTLATVNSNTGSFGSSTAIPVVTVNGKGLVTAVSTATVAGGQYFGSAATKAIAYNSNSIAENVTVTSGNNGLSAGPITISGGFAVTVASGSRWVVL